MTLSSLQSLFPGDVAVVTVTPGMVLGALHPAEEVHVRNAVPKRRREFTAGRHCAREALARLGIHGVAIPAGPDRAPEWPDGITGSISHCDSLCAAVAARVGRIVSLGLDIESVEPLSRELVSLVGTCAEIEEWDRASGELALDPAKLAFCAKESVYKADYPLTKRFLDFHDVEVAFDFERETFIARIGGVRSLHGCYGTDGKHVFARVLVTAPMPT
ncbi:MAG: 4'-phosphopantetheinyl transferase superfamily protein [Planctomycetota bacterium]|nr:MAG: 4'-phosphopantetheinyl transferase superfamily protein [Planctomycetota bacterium]